MPFHILDLLISKSIITSYIFIYLFYLLPIECYSILLLKLTLNIQYILNFLNDKIFYIHIRKQSKNYNYKIFIFLSCIYFFENIILNVIYSIFKRKALNLYFFTSVLKLLGFISFLPSVPLNLPLKISTRKTETIWYFINVLFYCIVIVADERTSKSNQFTLITEIFENLDRV